MTADYLAKATYDVARGSAPELWANQFDGNELPSYVRLTASTRSAEFRVTVRPGTASSNQFWVPPGTFGLNEGQTVPVSPARLSGSNYRLRKLTRTGAGLLTILGLVLAVVGIAISGSLAVGEAWAPIQISSGQQAVLLIVASFLEAVGLTLVLVRGVLFGSFLWD